MRVQTPKETLRMITCRVPSGCLRATTAALRAMSKPCLLHLTKVFQYFDRSRCASFILPDPLKWIYYLILSAYADNTLTSKYFSIHWVLFNIGLHAHRQPVVICDRGDGLMFTWKKKSSTAHVALVNVHACIWCDSTCAALLAHGRDVLQGKPN